jgi:hypothetical protein
VMSRLDSPGEMMGTRGDGAISRDINWTSPLLLLSKWGGDRVAIGEVFHVSFGEE